MKAEFHAEFNPDMIYFLPTICWARLEDETGKPAGSVLQFHFLNLSAQFLWPV